MPRRKATIGVAGVLKGPVSKKLHAHMAGLFSKYREVFSRGGDDIGHTD